MHEGRHRTELAVDLTAPESPNQLPHVIHAVKASFGNRVFWGQAAIGSEGRLRRHFKAGMVVPDDSGHVCPPLSGQPRMEEEVLIWENCVGQGCEGGVGGLSDGTAASSGFARDQKTRKHQAC